MPVERTDITLTYLVYIFGPGDEARARFLARFRDRVRKL